MLDDFEVTFRNDRGMDGSERSVAVHSRTPRNPHQNHDRNPPLPPDINSPNPPPPPDHGSGNRNGSSSAEEPSDEKMRTLWVGGLSEKVEEEVLYELFLNAGPLQRVSHPVDRDTKKKKPFAFIVYEHRESIKYAFDIFNGIEFYGRPLKLQQKETGLGIHVGRMNPNMFNNHDSRDRGGFGGGHNRSYSTSSLPRPSQRRPEADNWGRDNYGGIQTQQSYPPPPHQMMSAMNGNFNMPPQQQFGGSYDGGRGFNQYNDHYSSGGHDRRDAQQWNRMDDRRDADFSRRDREDRYSGRDSHRDDRGRDRDYHRDRSHHREYDSRGSRR